MDLRNYEVYAGSSNPLVGVTVKCRVASVAHPNTGTVIAQTTTNTSGMWEFTGLADGNAYDVEVELPGLSKRKWYKGASKLNCSAFSVNGVAVLVDSAGTINPNRLVPGANQTVLVSNGTAASFSGSPTVSGTVTAGAFSSAGTASVSAVNVSSTGAAAGEVKTSSHIRGGANLYLNNQTTFHQRMYDVQYINGLTTTTALFADTAIGFLKVFNLSQGTVGIFHIKGTVGPVLLVGSSSEFDVVASNNNKVNVIRTGGFYYIYNGYSAGNYLYIGASYEGT